MGEGRRTGVGAAAIVNGNINPLNDLNW